jgi:hypothetical protein
MRDVELNRTAIERMFNDPDGPVARELIKVGLRVVRVAKRMCPVDNGPLRASIGIDRVKRDARGLYISIGSDKEYAAAVEFGSGLFGTGPGAKRQRITAKNGKALRFKIGGQVIFRRSVAGQQPQPFLRPALREVVGAT